MKHIGNLDVRKDLRVRGRIQESLRVRKEVEASSFYIRGGGELLSGGIQSNLNVAQQTTSGTSFTFNSPFTTVAKIEIFFQGVSLSGTDDLVIRIGDSGGLEVTDYISTSIRVDGGGTVVDSSSITGFIIRVANSGRIVSGKMEINRLGSNTWISSHTVKTDTTGASSGGGDKTLSAELTSVSVTRDGTDTFDAGQVSVRWWGN